MSDEELKAIEGGVLLLSAPTLEELKVAGAQSFDGLLFDVDPKGHRLSQALQNASASFDATAPFRMAIVATWSEFTKRQTLAGQAMMDPAKWGFLQAQGVLTTDQAPLPPEAKTVYMYPGQGSQYVGMTADLVQRFTAPARRCGRRPTR